MKLCCRLAVVLFALNVWASVHLAAWEQDVHAVLTFWLATQAGFSRQDASLIANADQSFDNSNHTAAIGIVGYIIVTGSEEAGRELQKKHFPSDTLIAAVAPLRAVAPNSPAARHAADDATRKSDRGDRLRTLGEALHPFQDSWSHQGVPDVPYNLWPTLASGHPAARGGWHSHNADLTHLHVDETVDMARRTYEILQTFLKNNPRSVDHAAADWASLEPTVREFAQLSDRAQKNDWAAKFVAGQASAAPGQIHPVNGALTLPGPQPSAPIRVRAQRPSSPQGQPRREAPLPDVPADLVDTANKFFRVWLQDKAVATASRQFVDLESLGKQFPNGLPTSTGNPVAEWAEKFLTMLLVDDHAAVNRAGHGEPREPGYRSLSRTPLSEGPFRATRPIAALTLAPEDFVATNLTGAAAFGTGMSFSNLPHDSVIFVWQRVRRGWSVVRMFAIPE